MLIFYERMILSGESMDDFSSESYDKRRFIYCQYFGGPKTDGYEFEEEERG